MNEHLIRSQWVFNLILVFSFNFFLIFKELIQEKQQFLGLLKQLKDFDENLTRELIAKAYQDQERKRLQVNMKLNAS